MIRRALEELKISTHAPRTGSDCIPSASTRRRNISTHAPRTGSDVRYALDKSIALISTHAPRTGSDGLPEITGKSEKHFNPRSPHGERLLRKLHRVLRTDISTHAPRTGSDAADENVPP